MNHGLHASVVAKSNINNAIPDSLTVVDLEFLQPVGCAGDWDDGIDLRKSRRVHYLSAVFEDLHLVFQQFRVQIIGSSRIFRVVQ
jgi:hypothetical protein